MAALSRLPEDGQENVRITLSRVHYYKMSVYVADKWMQSRGSVLGKNIKDISIESVKEKWDAITDMTTPNCYDTIQESSGELFGKLEPLLAASETDGGNEFDPVKSKL